MEHVEVLTLLTLITVPASLIFFGLLFSTGDTPEASELQGFPETLGDFPPLGDFKISIEVPLTDEQAEVIDKMIRGEE